jgi:hypothetical protein
MSSGICQYSGGEEFYCNRYHDDTEVTFINPYNGEQNFTFYIISDENHEDTKNDGEMENNMNTLIMKLVFALNFLLLFVIIVICTGQHMDNCNRYNRRRKTSKLL